MAWLRGLDLNQRPLGYEPNELPDCSTPRQDVVATFERLCANNVLVNQVLPSEQSTADGDCMTTRDPK